MDVEREAESRIMAGVEDSPLSKDSRPVVLDNALESDNNTDTATINDGDGSGSITDVTGLSTCENGTFIDTGSDSQQDNPSSRQRARQSSNQQETDWRYWYNHKCFRRYWQHYQFTMSWCQKHYQTYKLLRRFDDQSYFSQGNRQRTTSRTCMNMPSFCQKNSNQSKPKNSNQSKQIPSEKERTPNRHNIAGGIADSSESVQSKKSSGRKSRKRSRRKKKKIMEVRELTQKEDVTEEMSIEETGDAAEEEEEAFEMEITDDMLDFFLTSHKHKKERDADKMDESQSRGGQELLNVENVKVDQKAPTAEAPKERPGFRRTAEMKLLYGKNAAMIHGMETALQMTFDRNIDIKQPKLWPNMPLNLVFN